MTSSKPDEPLDAVARKATAELHWHVACLIVALGLADLVLVKNVRPSTGMGTIWDFLLIGFFLSQIATVVVFATWSNHRGLVKTIVVMPLLFCLAIMFAMRDQGSGTTSFNLPRALGVTLVYSGQVLLFCVLAKLAGVRWELRRADEVSDLNGSDTKTHRMNRRTQVQFSILGILTAMFVVGVAITAFRYSKIPPTGLRQVFMIASVALSSLLVWAGVLGTRSPIIPWIIASIAWLIGVAGLYAEGPGDLNMPLVISLVNVAVTASVALVLRVAGVRATWRDHLLKT